MEKEQSFNEKVLEKYRRILFPEISKGTITGYNVYLNRPTRSQQFLVDYLHSDLGFNEKGEPHRHRKELFEKLSKVGKLNMQQNLVNAVIDRIAIYRIGDWEENPEDLRFFDSEGNFIAYEEVNKYDGVLIAEGKQYDLGIEIDDPGLLKIVLDLFNKHTCAYKVSSKGEVRNVINPNAIYGAWEIPLIVVGSGSVFKRPDYRRVFDFTIDDENHEISALVRKKARNLEEFLRVKTLLFSKARKYANRPFVELYLDAGL